MKFKFDQNIYLCLWSEYNDNELVLHTYNGKLVVKSNFGKYLLKEYFDELYSNGKLEFDSIYDECEFIEN